MVVWLGQICKLWSIFCLWNKYFLKGIPLIFLISSKSKKGLIVNKNGYMSFRPTPFQPLQFQPLQFQPFTFSTVLTFNRLPFRPLANSTATSSTYLIKFKVIKFFQDVRKQVN